jgi:tetratricopeptide (TPR) repeat protein
VAAKKSATDRKSAGSGAQKNKKPAIKRAAKNATVKPAAPKTRSAAAAKPAGQRGKPAEPPRTVKKAAAVVSHERAQLADSVRQAEERQTASYEKGMEYFNSRQFGKALPYLEKAADGPHSTLRQRARTYVQICQQHADSSKLDLKTPEDLYNYGVKLINDRRLDEAEQYLRKALRMAPKAGHIHYATAVLSALTRDVASTLQNLKRAIELDPRNRVQALNDVDLAGVAGDPLIAELLHAEGTSDQET